jgi:cytochrome c-type biogenesis protein CcmH/NrfG
MKLDHEIPAQYYLARALAAKGDYQAARDVLVAIPRGSPQYAAALQLLSEIDQVAPQRP